jgi:signal transduction histidine kinase
LQVGRSSGTDAALLREFRSIFFRVLLPVVVLGVLGGALVGHRALGPLRALSGTAREISRTGDLKKRVPVPRSGGELARLASVFNEMLERNDQLVTVTRQSLDNVAHDLRTPMTRLRSTAEAALTSGDQGGASVREALADCLEESDRVLATLDALMDVAEAETGTMRLRREAVDLAALVRQTAEVYELVAEEAGVALVVEAPEPVPASGDPARLQQVVANLADNAIKFSNRGGTVRLCAFLDGATRVPTLQVADDGPGVAPDEAEKIWDRLYRSDRSRHQRGLGLGLSLVRAITAAHGGTATLASEPGRGATFTVRLPAREPGEGVVSQGR